MDYIAKDNKVVFKNKNFNPKHIFECGQAFRWEKNDDGSYTNVAFNRVINVKQEEDNIILDNVSEEDFNNIWIDYFDLNRDYDLIKSSLANNETMIKALNFGYGIRILNQEAFETIISFIISANNQISRIKKSIDIICKEYGDEIGDYRGKTYYSFPTSKKLSSAKIDDLRQICRVGFRDKRIVDTSRLIESKEFNIEESTVYNSKKLFDELIKLPGIGPKVASCIMLFSYGKTETFPVDVWIKRVMETLYIGEETTKKNIGVVADKIFGEYAGFAQQYLFYYGRENKIGK
ncbi:DNA glycosylase [Lagierella sp.]|uniref:DNA-3-methyladenine glycosylase family protein n=1 Tax=Lagierella sp. TaxID=2849657 RepID=UPI00263A13A7|nr:DNA glycosylase [Lagierella sp.]